MTDEQRTRLDALESQIEQLERQRESLKEAVLRLARQLGYDDLADAFEARDHGTVAAGVTS